MKPSAWLAAIRRVGVSIEVVHGTTLPRRVPGPSELAGRGIGELLLNGIVLDSAYSSCASMKYRSLSQSLDTAVNRSAVP